MAEADGEYDDVRGRPRTPTTETWFLTLGLGKRFYFATTRI